MAEITFLAASPTHTMTNKHTDDTPMLPPLPMRTVATSLPHPWVDEIDAVRMTDPDLPSRSEVIRYGVELFLRWQRLPPELRVVLYEALTAFEEELTETPAASIGEPMGNA